VSMIALASFLPYASLFCFRVSPMQPTVRKR
jgi:hypothetical protein